MRKVLILLSIASLITMTACREDKQSDTLKVGINYNKGTSNQKINVIRDATGAYINWNGSDKIALYDAVSGLAITTATFKNSNSDNTANFSLPEGTSLDYGNYAVYYPSTAIPGNTFSTPDYYLIDPTDLNDYLNDKLLMYTQTPYRHGTDEKIQLTPAMTVLELPLSTPAGTLIINDITISGIDDYYESVDDAFIKSAILPTNISNNFAFSNTTYSSSITYVFTEPLIVTADSVIIKLLIWSNPNCTLTKYQITINSGEDVHSATDFYYRKTIDKTTPLLNNKYYALPALSVPQPKIDDYYQGGLICSVYIESNVTHGYVYDLNLTIGRVKRPWSLDTSNVNTGLNIGDGIDNTNNILNRHGGNIAAHYCREIHKVYGPYKAKTYGNWFLPSLEEIKLIPYLLANFWTSSQDDSDTTKVYTYGTITGESSDGKTNQHSIMPMRRF